MSSSSSGIEIRQESETRSPFNDVAFEVIEDNRNPLTEESSHRSSPVPQENNSLEDISDQLESEDEGMSCPDLKSSTESGDLEVDERIPIQEPTYMETQQTQIRKAQTLQPEMQFSKESEQEIIIFEYEEDYETDL